MKHPNKLPLFFLLIALLSMFHAQPIDPYEYLHIIPNNESSITRMKEFYPTVPPNTSSSIAFSKDVPLNPDKSTWIRVYLPRIPEPVNLPIIVYAHGGGFILLSTATPNFDSFLSNMSSHLKVLVVSVEYRLAPEHRLPAAYDDVLEALHWVKGKKDDWVRKFGDVSRCIVMGESSGGNIAYNVGLRASNEINGLNPLVIRGLVLIQPFFGGVHRTKSELRLGVTGVIPLVVTDLLWNLSLPLGANRNHPYCNPVISGGSNELSKIKDLGWRVVIAGCDGDLFFDKQVELFNFLQHWKVDVMGEFNEGDYHGVFINDLTKSQEFFEFVRSAFSEYF